MLISQAIKTPALLSPRNIQATLVQWMKNKYRTLREKHFRIIHRKSFNTRNAIYNTLTHTTERKKYERRGPGGRRCSSSSASRATRPATARSSRRRWASRRSRAASRSSADSSSSSASEAAARSCRVVPDCSSGCVRWLVVNRGAFQKFENVVV